MRTDLQWEVVTPFVESVTVRPDDTDVMGHTNNVVYLGWLERVAWSHTRALGMGIERYRALNTGCVARRHELDYLAATFAGEELILGTWIDENDGRLSMWRAYQIIRVSDGRTVMRGRTHWVCIDMKTGKPKRQPPEFIEAYVPAQRFD
ncbi:MAG: thioesterase family protein [Nevskia sp.]